MAFGIPGSGPANGEIVPRVQYDARAGRLSKINRVQTAQGWENDSVDITGDKPAFAVDFGTLQIGYAKFATTGPAFAMAPFGQPIPAQPPEMDEKTGRFAYRPAFKVMLWAPRTLDGKREFASSAACVLTAMDTLHGEYLRAPEAAKGRIPVVRLTGTKAIKTSGGGQTSTNYAPVFELVDWADRPLELGERTNPVPVPPAAAFAQPAGAQPSGRTYAVPERKPAPELISDEVPF